MYDNTVPVNNFGGSTSDQLGTYPIPPAILADDQQTKLNGPLPSISHHSNPVQNNLNLNNPIHSNMPINQSVSHQNNNSYQEHYINNTHSSSPNPISLHNSATILQAPPPIGSQEEADIYIQTLIRLVNHDKLDLSHTDLKQFDPSTLQDHYLISLDDEYEIEVSHGKSPDSDKEFYILLFNQLNKVQEICVNKIILGYIHLSPTQFGTFKNSADSHLNKKKVAQEHDRFKSALSPIDQMLNNLSAKIIEESPLESDQSTVDDEQSDLSFQQVNSDVTDQSQPPYHNQPLSTVESYNHQQDELYDTQTPVALDQHEATDTLNSENMPTDDDSLSQPLSN